MKIRAILSACFALGLTACASDQVLSQEEMRIQSAADTAVAGYLFDHKMDELMSYIVRRDGFVLVKFHDSVQPSVYNKVVAELRDIPDIHGVHAEKSGVEVCPTAR